MKGRSFKSATSKLARFSVVCYGWLKRNACVFCSNVKSEEALRPMSVFLDCTFGRLPQTSQQALSNLTGTHGLHSIQASFIMCGMISGLKHAAMCKLWPYCKPYILYFVFFHVRLKCAEHANIIRLYFHIGIWLYQYLLLWLLPLILSLLLAPMLF